MADSMFLFENKVRVKPIEPPPETANLTLRYLAFIIDMFFLVILLFFVEVFLGAYMIQRESPIDVIKILIGHAAYWLIPAQLINFIYFGFFYLAYGASPGKMIFGLKLVSTRKGVEITPSQIFVREVLGKFFSYMFFGLGFLIAFARRDGRAFHDLLSSCQVVPEGQKSPRVR